MSDQELEGLEISLLWTGPTDKPAPEIVLVCKERRVSSQPVDPFRPIVPVSKEQARAVLAVIGPIVERDNGITGKDGGYVVRVRMERRHLESSLGGNAKSQASIPAEISEKLGAEGKSAIAPLMAYRGFSGRT
jgi:hypothetical protein